MNMRPASDRAERSMRALLFLALMLGVSWAVLADGGQTDAAASIADVLGGR